MKIQTIEIRNFKRLRNFKLNLQEQRSNLAFINGSNGNGKTTFLNALRWGFFGENPTGDAYSYAALEALEDGELSEMTVEIKLILNDAGDCAVISREQLVRCSGSGKAKTAELAGNSELSVTLIYGNLSKPSELHPNPESWLESFMPQRFKRFILFDGEHMYKFFDLSVKGAIEEAIREIAKIDLFNDAMGVIGAAQNRINQKLAKLSGKTAEKIEQDLAFQRELHARHIISLKNLRSAKEELEVRIDELKSGLRGKEQLEVFLESNKDIREKIDLKTARYRELEVKLSKILLLTGVNNLLLSRTKYPIQKQVKEAAASGKYPADFSPSALEELLESEICICGCDLAADSNGKAHIKRIIATSLNAGEIGIELKKIELGLANTEGMLGQQKEVHAVVISEMKSIENELSSLRSELSELEPQLAGVKGNHEGILELSRLLKRSENEKQQIFHDEMVMAQKVNLIAKEVSILDRKFEKALDSSNEAKELRSRAQFLSRVLSQGSQFADEILAKVRAKLEQNISGRFKTVDGCAEFSVTVTEEFDVKALNVLSKEPELSEGQKMALAYIFSIALREVVGLELPLLVDTPISRLNTKNRSLIADLLKVLAESQQVILMMHDAEYTPYTKSDFASALPYEAHLAFVSNLESELHEGIDPEWLTRDAWADWAKGNIKI